jgi:hypothetical protein
MRRSVTQIQRILLVAVAPVAGAALSSVAGAQTPPRLPLVPLDYSSLSNVRVNALSGSRITAMPLSSPPINGFVPRLVFGLTDEDNPDNELFAAEVASYTAGSPPPGAVRLPGGSGTYRIATFDTGSQAHIISLGDAPAFNFSGNNLDAGTEAQLAGANGSEFASITKPLGVYTTGLANASAVGSTISASGLLRGQTNTAILYATDPDSVLPNVIGAPILAQYQVAIRNSQPQTLQVGATTYRSPNVTMTPLETAPAFPSNYSRLTLEVLSPNGVSPTASYIPTISGNFEFVPSTPTFWSSLHADVDLTDSGNAVNDRQFLFDTGAQVTVLSQDTAAEVGIYSAGENPSTPEFFVDVEGVGGTQQVPGYYLDTFSVMTNGGPITWKDVPVLVLDLIDPRDGVGYAPGILGMNLFTDRDLILNGGLENPSVAISPQMQWATNTSGNWSDVAKWMLSAVPNGVDRPANFLKKITAPQTITVNGNFTAGSINFDNANRYTIAGSGILTLQSAEGAAAITVGSGSHTISAPLVLASDTTITVLPAASKLTISGSFTATGRTVTKRGDGTVEMKNIRAAGLDVTAGRFAVIANGAAAGTSVLSALSVSGTGQVDVSNNAMIVRGPSGGGTGALGTWDGTNYTGIQGLVQNGFNAGTWDGVGGIITTQAAALTNINTVGSALAGEVLGLSGAQTTTWFGQTVGSSDVLVRYTFAGDANLDGVVNADDYANIDLYSQTPGAANFSRGDFNYDGSINADDYALIDLVSTQQRPALLDVGSVALTAVPEPSTFALAVLAAPLLLRRRRFH